MTNQEFREIAPNSNFTLDSFLNLLKNSAVIGANFQCTKETISLNKIVQVTMATSLSITASQVFLIIQSITGVSVTVPGNLLINSLGDVAVTTTGFNGYNDLVGMRRVITAGGGICIVAVFDLF